VVISDGADTASTVSLRELRSALLRTDAFVYAIAIDPPERQAINTRVNPQTLREITAETGGRTEIVQSSSQLVEATAQIALELNSQYVLGYTSPRGADGQFHSIRVRAAGADYRVRARSGYIATPRVRPKSDY
jgi:VWFA-related protein